MGHFRGDTNRIASFSNIATALHSRLGKTVQLSADSAESAQVLTAGREYWYGRGMVLTAGRDMVLTVVEQHYHSLSFLFRKDSAAEC